MFYRKALIIAFVCVCYLLLNSVYYHDVNVLLKAIDSNDVVKVEKIMCDPDLKKYINKKGGSAFPFTLFNETNSRTPYEAAIESGNLDIIRMVVKHGAVRAKNQDDDEVAFVISTHRWSKELEQTILCLIKSGASPDGTMNYPNDIPLIQIAYMDITESEPEQILTLYKLVQAECKHKAPVSKTYGVSALHAAAYSGNASLIEYLLDNQVYDVNIRDTDGNTPLFYLFDEEQTTEDRAEEAVNESYRILVEHGADVNAKNNEGKTVEEL